ncbi:MAG: hypothetical protein U5K37_05595 [Natrialbaceae archaeon]|nr:hypothetical protein [Natrialbaceae archaeon]
MVKPMAIGGVGQCFETLQGTGSDPIITSTFDGVVARTAAVHLAAALDCSRACGLATANRLEADVTRIGSYSEERRTSLRKQAWESTPQR